MKRRQPQTIWSRNIELLQAYAGVSTKQLVEGTGLSRPTIHKYKNDPNIKPRVENQGCVARFFTEKLGQQFTPEDIFGRVIRPEELSSKLSPPITIDEAMEPEHGEELLCLNAQLTVGAEWREHPDVLRIVFLANLSKAIEGIGRSLAGIRYFKSRLMASNPSSPITDTAIIVEALDVLLRVHPDSPHCSFEVVS